MNLPLYQVDAFTDKMFSGNPAAVCLLDKARDDRWLQALAAEMNLSETAFLLKQADGYNLRWFTPIVEVELCGHATLAGAHMLFESRLLDRSSAARFHTLSGLLTARSVDGWIELDFPSQPPKRIDPPRHSLLHLESRQPIVERVRENTCSRWRTRKLSANCSRTLAQ